MLEGLGQFDEAKDIAPSGQRTAFRHYHPGTGFQDQRTDTRQNEHHWQWLGPSRSSDIPHDMQQIRKQEDLYAINKGPLNVQENIPTGIPRVIINVQIPIYLARSRLKVVSATTALPSAAAGEIKNAVRALHAAMKP